MAKLYFYYSSMDAGKTTTLLQANYNYREKGLQTLLLTPEIDDRYGVGRIVSRVGIEADAYPFPPNFDFYDFIQHKQVDCVLIDEAQFLRKSQIEQICEIVDFLSIPILCYGLRTDFRGEVFEGSRYLLAWADCIEEIKSICHCGAKATMTLRLDDSGRVVEKGQSIDIGGNEKYVAVCRKHFLLKQARSPQRNQQELSDLPLREKRA